MARTPGARNADHAERRVELLARLWSAWMAQGPGVSLRQLADAAETHPSVLRHYFGDRDDVVRALMEHARASSAPYREAAAIPRGEDPATVLGTFLAELRAAWQQHGVGRLHSVGLAEGLAASALGPAYVRDLLEPTVQPAEALLSALVERGALPELEVRTAALALVAPVVLALLHQDDLGGRACRPLDLDAFLDAHLRGWLAGWGSPPPERS